MDDALHWRLHGQKGKASSFHFHYFLKFVVAVHVICGAVHVQCGVTWYG